MDRTDLDLIVEEFEASEDARLRAVRKARYLKAKQHAALGLKPLAQRREVTS